MGIGGPDPQETASQFNQTQYGSVVIISPLPVNTTKRDILCRVRGGKVISCNLSRFRGTLLAIVKFEDQASAHHYVDFCAESFNKELWTFPSSPETAPSSHMNMTSRVKIYNDAPGLGVTWRPEDIPGIPKAYPSTTTRCLFFENCPAERVTRFWAGLGLGSSEHLRTQLDDMWLDGPKWDGAAGMPCGTLHVWFSDIESAIEAQRRISELKFEADPCSTMPTKAFILGPDKTGIDVQDDSKNDSEDVYIDHHSYPFVSLLDLHRVSVLSQVARGLLDPYEVFWGIQAPQPVEEVEEQINLNDLTERLMHVLNTHVNGQRNNTHSVTQSSISYPTSGDAVHLSGGLGSSSTNGTGPQLLPGMNLQADNIHADRTKQQVLPTSGMINERAEPPQERHEYHMPPSINKFNTQAQFSSEDHANNDALKVDKIYGTAEPRQSDSTHRVDAPPPGRLDFKMPRPLPGYTYQFPPPMSGEPRVVEYPPAIAEAMKQQSRGPGYLARRIASLGRQYHCQRPSCIHTVASQNPGDEDTSHQSGRSAGSGDSF